MNKLNSMMAIALFALTFTACKKDDKEPEIVVPVSDGSTLTLNGIAGSEDGASAANSVYVDFSADKQTSVLRDSWDLGFYAGADFKVIINATNGASALVVNKTDINTVTAADFDANALKVGQGSGVLDDKKDDNGVIIQRPAIDDPREDNIINKTVIAAISSTDVENKVYIINRKGGANTVLPTADLYKIRVLRKGTTGYTLQYAKVGETTFKTIEITKNAEANFQFVSLVSEKNISVEPTKANWDIVWGYSMHYTATFPYGFSDLVFTNSLAGVTAAEVLTTDFAYADFSEANLSSTKVKFSASKNVISSFWRKTTGTPLGVLSDRFYLIKDGTGNYYKLKFISMGVGTDGGTRGKPVIEYKLVKKG